MPEMAASIKATTDTMSACLINLPPCYNWSTDEADTGELRDIDQLRSSPHHCPSGAPQMKWGGHLAKLLTREMIQLLDELHLA